MKIAGSKKPGLADTGLSPVAIWQPRQADKPNQTYGDDSRYAYWLRERGGL